MGAHLIRWREEWQRGEGNWELLPLTVVPHRGCHRQLSSGRLSVFVLLHILINRLQEQLTQPEMEPALGRACQADSEPDLEPETELWPWPGPGARPRAHRVESTIRKFMIINILQALNVRIVFDVVVVSAPLSRWL